MAMTRQEIIIEIKFHMDRHGGNYSDWYVGIASNPRDRLFNAHNVDEKNGTWIYREAENSSSARDIEDYFVNTLKTDGGTGGGDYSSRYVYAYKKTFYTNE
jgi:hypothetical protein